ncbi:hypothetical protein SAMN02745243_02171 [Hespellia stercorisuis DSM 15480]|uniref:Glutamyl-tRNA amidotransferase n=3 Tax=Bacillota TaxID=1239 RepID=A0A4R6Q2I9_9FIRM|nr:hypothetical protein EV211_11523 [Aminicella lysinilytica]SHK09405.1 hypothetical protein SAMN02745243_02171 [Hespellia stercorisuis DSM 15480]
MNFYPMRILKETTTYNLEEMNMTFFKKNNETKVTKKLPMTGKVKKGFKAYCTMMIMGALIIGTGTVAFAAEGGDPLTVINNLSTFIFSLIRAIGLILLGFGIVQVGLSLKSHDPSQRANGFLTLAGGIIITFAKEILTLITGA